jgi:serine/threonine-protein kinase
MSGEHVPTEGALLSDRYRLERLLGAGGQGRVYAEVDEQLGRRVAVKDPLPLTELSTDPRQEALARFDREVRALARLAHDHIVTIFDRGTHQGTPFSVMEFLDGPSLAQKLRESGPLPAAQAVDVCARSAGALSAAHHLRIWHRDVKPANILLTGTGRPKLCDFGLVSALTPAAPLLTRRGTTPGCTPGYASPEQARGATAAGPSDVFSLGVTL